MSISQHTYFAVIINNVKITGDYVNNIHDSIQDMKIMQYWNEQGWFPAEQHNHIDWDVIRQARLVLPF